MASSPSPSKAESVNQNGDSEPEEGEITDSPPSQEEHLPRQTKSPERKKHKTNFAPYYGRETKAYYPKQRNSTAVRQNFNLIALTPDPVFVPPPSKPFKEYYPKEVPYLVEPYQNPSAPVYHDDQVLHSDLNADGLLADSNSVNDLHVPDSVLTINNSGVNDAHIHDSELIGKSNLNDAFDDLSYIDALPISQEDTGGDDDLTIPLLLNDNSLSAELLPENSDDHSLQHQLSPVVNNDVNHLDNDKLPHSSSCYNRRMPSSTDSVNSLDSSNQLLHSSYHRPPTNDTDSSDHPQLPYSSFHNLSLTNDFGSLEHSQLPHSSFHNMPMPSSSNNDIDSLENNQLPNSSYHNMPTANDVGCLENNQSPHTSSYNNLAPDLGSNMSGNMTEASVKLLKDILEFYSSSPNTLEDLSACNLDLPFDNNFFTSLLPPEPLIHHTDEEIEARKKSLHLKFRNDCTTIKNVAIEVLSCSNNPELINILDESLPSIFADLSQAYLKNLKTFLNGTE